MLFRSMYIAYVRRVCSDTEQGNWADIKVVTSCQEIPLPYFESLSGEILPPTCWERYSSLLSSVINGGTLSSSSSGWNRTTVDQGIIGTHMRTNNYGGSHNAWLTTPTFIIDTTAILSFDLALTKYSDATADPTSNFSQSFMVLVSDDAGQSWNMNNATVWNDSIGDHGFLAIPKTAMRYSVDLGKYVGNEIMIAFYSESRRSGGDNFIHLGNVAIKPAASSQLYDDACLGYGYTSNGLDRKSVV